MAGVGWSRTHLVTLPTRASLFLVFLFLAVGHGTGWLIMFCVAHETRKMTKTQCWYLISGNHDSRSKWFNSKLTANRDTSGKQFCHGAMPCKSSIISRSSGPGTSNLKP